MTLAKNTILVVDDRPASRYTLAHALKRAGYYVLEAGTGTEALELAAQVPSAILLDVKLPDILGYEVCRRLKANPRTSHIPVLQLSAAFLDNESRVYALESGADAYLTQPVEPNVLVATVKSLVKIHEAESLAKLSSKQWQSTFDALSEGVAVLNESGNIARCNRALTELLGQSYTEIEGKLVSDVLGSSLVANLANDQGVQAGEVVRNSRYFQVRIEPVLMEGPTGGILVLTDLTGRKMAEHAALMNERLATTGRMAHTIAHEINNPLEAITNLLFLMRSPHTTSEEAMKYLSAAEEEVARVSRITKQILTFHRESSTPTSVHLGNVLDDVLALNNRAILERQLKLRKEFASDVYVEGFPAQLRQVFSNIVRNAIDASEDGGEIRIRISRSYAGHEAAEAAARVTIADNGCGIPKESIAKVFDAFFTTKQLKGTGVGLWLSSTLVQEHGGRVQLRSSASGDRRGTSVSVLLPAMQK